jgi:hypothetical protein
MLFDAGKVLKDILSEALGASVVSVFFFFLRNICCEKLMKH